MMAKTILTRLRQAGVALSLRDGQLAYDAPDGALTPPLHRALVHHKTEVIALLTTSWWPTTHLRPSILSLCRTHGVAAVRAEFAALDCDVAKRMPSWEELYMVAEVLGQRAGHAPEDEGHRPTASEPVHCGGTGRDLEHREGLDNED